MGLTDVRDAQLGWIKLVSCPHGTDDGNTGSRCTLHQFQFGCNSIHCIHNKVIHGQIHLIRRFRQIKHLSGLNLDIRVNILQPLLHDVRFLHANGGVERNHLPVQVRQGHRVVIK